MASDTSFLETDIVPHEFRCKEGASRTSEVADVPKSVLDGDDGLASEKHGIPRMPGVHDFAVCTDVGFIVAAGAAVPSSRSRSQASGASGEHQGNDAASGMAEHCSSSYFPLKRAARLSDLVHNVGEDGGCKGECPQLEGRESGISLNESMLLSVDLTTTDLGTICDCDNNDYTQVVLGSLLTEDNTRHGEPGNRTDISKNAYELKGRENMGEGIQITGKVKIMHSSKSGDTCSINEHLRMVNDERTNKFKVVPPVTSSSGVFEDAGSSNGNTFSDTHYEFHNRRESEAKVTKSCSSETVINDRLDSLFHDVRVTTSERRFEKPDVDVLKISDTEETGTYPHKGSSINGKTQSLVESETNGPDVKPASAEVENPVCTDIIENFASVEDRRGITFKNARAVAMEALSRMFSERSVVTILRAVFYFGAAFVLLYAPSIIITILTLYLQLLLCAIFVDIFLN